MQIMEMGFDRDMVTTPHHRNPKPEPPSYNP